MDLANLFKNLIIISYNTVFIVLLIIIMGFLFGGNYAHIGDAYRYFTVTFIIYAILSGAMTASNCFMERDIKKPNLRIIYSPAGSFSIYFSKLLASFIFDYIFHTIVLVCTCTFLHVTISNLPLFILSMAPVEFMSVSFGIFFCCVFHSEETTSTLLSTIVSVLSALGGTFFSLDGMGKAMAFISDISPVKWLNIAFFRLAFDNNLSYILPTFIISILISVALIIGCHFTFRTEDYL